MEYPLDEVAASVSDDTERWEQVAVAKLSLSDIISSGTINKNFDALILVRSALTISQIFDPLPPDDSIIAEARKCLILGESLINELWISKLLSKSVTLLKQVIFIRVGYLLLHIVLLRSRLAWRPLIVIFLLLSN